MKQGVSETVLSFFHVGNTGSNPVGDAKVFPFFGRLTATVDSHGIAETENEAVDGRNCATLDARASAAGQTSVPAKIKRKKIPLLRS